VPRPREALRCPGFLRFLRFLRCRVPRVRVPKVVPGTEVPGTPDTVGQGKKDTTHE